MVVANFKIKMAIRFIFASTLLILSTVLLPIRSSSQERMLKKTEKLVYGHIEDSTSQQPLQFSNVTVSHKGNRLISVVSDNTGKFEFRLDSVEYVDVKISLVGYREKYLKNIKITNDTIKLSLSTIYLESENVLETVFITKRVPVIENKLDKMIYHVSNDPSLLGTTGEDVFKKLPMVSLGYDGKVALRGNQHVKILINGKPSGIMSGNISDALRMIPSSQIKSVEIMTNPSLKYDVEGGGGIINIVTNRLTVQGLNGGVAATIGTRQSNQSSNLAARIGHFGITGSFGNSWSYPIASVFTTENLTPQKERVFSQKNDSRNRRNGTQFAIAMDYSLDSLNMLVANVNFNNLIIVTNNKIHSQYVENEFDGNVDNKQPIGNFDFSTDYIRKSGSSGREMSLSFQYLKSRNDLKYDSNYGNQVESGRNLGSNYEYTAQLDFKYPINSLSLDFGAKIVDRNINSVVNINTSDIDGSIQHDSNRSYSFKYHQNVMAGYATARMPIGESFHISGGVRWEKTILKGDETSNSSDFLNKSDNLFPNIAFSYSYSKNSTFKILYGKRIQRPSLYYLNPFRNNTDRTNQIQGNPRLKSEIIHNIEIGGDFNFFKDNGQINVSLYYKNTNDIIEPVAQNIIENGNIVMLQTFENIGRNKNFGTNFYGSLKFLKRFNLKANLDVYTYANSPYKDFLHSIKELNKTFIIYKTFIGMDINLGRGYTFDSYLFYDSPQRTFQGEFAAFNLLNISFKKKILKDAAVVGITIVDPFNNIKNLGNYSESLNFIQTGNFSIPFRSFGLSLSWQFGKNKSNAYQSKEKQIRNDDQKLST
ncbi:ferric enterobactin receptor [Sphingobacterium zeae]|uniref:Ferric enterobactin receptor n=2 Tax=Sphingobacterium zeae TaxID=1776859 RepID=A0ABU0U8Z9_9SPHI|nr:ferric enterobactin receptor [Sphingobacterium zeae]